MTDTLQLPRLVTTRLVCAAAMLVAWGVIPQLSSIARAGDGEAACMDARGGRPASAPQAQGYDADTGKDLRNYPPHRRADLLHMKLEVLIPDMNVPRFTATQHLRLSALAVPLETLELDARGLGVTSVKAEGFATSFKHDGRTLAVTFSPPLSPNQTIDLETVYSVDDPPLGLIWTPESPAWPGRPAQLHTQGEPETNSFWFPCRDFPNEKMTSEMVVTVPAGFMVSSNGRLEMSRHDIRTIDGPTGNRRILPFDTFRWVQEQPHSAYLVSLVVGKFDTADVGTPALSMPVWVPLGQGPGIRATFGRTPDMVSYFEQVTGQKYPWARYAQICVHNFGAGGMENTSATSLYDTVVIQPDALDDHDAEGLISHELAHQWFGDLCTCNSWEHIWLNEGFATYMTSLWFEHRDGKQRYQSEILEQFDNLIANDHADAPASIPMCSKVYGHAWEVFRKPANPYGKGAATLHMLRSLLGDDDFFAGVRLYVDRRKYDTAETSDLRQAFEAVSGLSLEQFFHQWCDRTGVPLLKVTQTYDAAAGQLNLVIEQTQNINGENPAFEFPLDVWTESSGGSVPTLDMHTVQVVGRTTTLNIPLAAAPEVVVIDPAMSVAAKIEMEQSEAAWRTVLERSLADMLYPRVQACRGIGAGKGTLAPQTADMLHRLAADERQPPRIRQEAIRALANRGAQTDIRSLASQRLGSWQVRDTLCGALADIALRDEFKDDTTVRQSITQALADRARKDSSTRVRSGALHALARVKGTYAAGIIREGLTIESQSDELRVAAIESLADLAPPGALEQLLIYTGPGVNSRTRASAVAAAAKVADQNTPVAVRVLSKLLGDRELRTRRAAGDALASLKDPAALAALEKGRPDARSDDEREQFDAWIKTQQGKAKE